MKNLKGKFAVITGAGKGIGRAIAQRFLEDNVAGVALFDMDLDLVSATALELDPTGEKVLAVRCDVSNQENVNAAFAQVNAKFGRVDILVNNAGTGAVANAEDITDEQDALAKLVELCNTEQLSIEHLQNVVDDFLCAIE